MIIENIIVYLYKSAIELQINTVFSGGNSGFKKGKWEGKWNQNSNRMWKRITHGDNICFVGEGPSKKYTNNEWYMWDSKLLFMLFDRSTKEIFNET